MIDSREKIALFVDGANLWATSKALDIEIDFKRLLDYFQEQAYMVRAYYFTTLTEDQEFTSLKPLMDWLNYNGFTVLSKPTKEYTDSTGRRRIKGNMNVDLTVQALDSSLNYDHMVLFSGDGEYTALIAALQRRGKHVTVVSTLKTEQPVISDDLRKQADFFIDLKEISEEICREA